MLATTRECSWDSSNKRPKIPHQSSSSGLIMTDACSSVRKDVEFGQAPNIFANQEKHRGWVGVEMDQ
jgi:hypothetical protein